MAGQAASGRTEAALLLLLLRLLQVDLMGTFVACCLSACAGQRRREGEDLLTKRRASMMPLPLNVESTQSEESDSKKTGGNGRKVAPEQHTESQPETAAGNI